MAGQEVERIRGLLDELEAIQHARNNEPSPTAAPYSLLLRKKEASPFARGGRCVICELYDTRDVSCAKQWASFDAAKTKAAGAAAEDATRESGNMTQPAMPRPEPICSRELPLSAEKALKAGRVGFLDAEDFDTYLSGALDQAAFDRICAKLGARERASRDVVSLLEREGYSRETACNAVERARRCGVIDDKRYAQAFVRAKVQAGWGQSRIARELGQAGLSLEDCDAENAEMLNGEQEYARALATARKKRMPDKNPTEKLARFLAGRGYSMAVSLRAAKQVVAESLEPPEESSGANGTCEETTNRHV